MKFRKAVFVVTYRKARPRFCKSYTIEYLVLRRKLRWRGWEFPKGGIEKNESVKQAVMREIKEETGQKANNIKNHHFKGKYKFLRGWIPYPGYDGQTFTLFSAEINNKKVKIDKREHSSYKWLEFSKAKKQLRFQDQKKSLSIVNKSINSA